MVNPRYTPIFASQGFKRLVGGTITEVTGKDISADAFQLALGASATQPPATGWALPTISTAGAGEPMPNRYGVDIPATAQRVLLLLVDGTVTPGTYHVWAKVPDATEVEAVWLAGPITVA